jgi:hypothetical protein
MNHNNLSSWNRRTAMGGLIVACMIIQFIEIVPIQAKQSPLPSIAGCQVFPLDNPWNLRIDNLPIHPRSDQWIDTIGRSTGFHMDFGSGTWNGGQIGIPYNIVDGSVPKVPVSFYYSSESDPGPYPIPASPLIEYGSDHHILILEKSSCTLYEIYDASYSSNSWSGGSGAIWNLNSNALRPEGWTSADAAGLPILPGLARYDEIIDGEIRHALRFTASSTNGYIWPARHLTSNDPAALHIPPMGARFRLKAAFNISGFPPELQIVLRAMKNYGIILADNGSDWYISGVPDERWNNDMLHLLDVLTGDSFEAVDSSELYLCSSLSIPSGHHFAAMGGTGSVSVTAANDCTWIADSNVHWITITGGSNGTGNGMVNYSVAANTTSSTRTGTITIGGQTFTVTQSGSLSDCSGDVVVLQNMTFTAGNTYNCTATTSITTGIGVTVQSGATVNFRAPKINFQPGFRVESGAVFSAKQ